MRFSYLSRSDHLKPIFIIWAYLILEALYISKTRTVMRDNVKPINVPMTNTNKRWGLNFFSGGTALSIIFIEYSVLTLAIIALLCSFAIKVYKQL